MSEQQVSTYPQAHAMSGEEMDIFLARPLIAKLCTHNPDGSIHIVPIWFRYANGEILLGTQEITQKVLSCVYRTGQRFGVTYVVDVLLGRDNDKIRRNGHAELSTYGIGGELKAAQWRALIRQLVVRGFLRVDMEAFNALRLTESSRSLLRAELSLHVRKEEPARGERGRSSAKSRIDPADLPVWQVLRACRKRLADEEGVPPYVIFHDATLQDMMRLRPRNESEMRLVSGVGDNKLRKYGAEFIAALEQAGSGDVW